jgi:hypothetical protein
VRLRVGHCSRGRRPGGNCLSSVAVVVGAGPGRGGCDESKMALRRVGKGMGWQYQRTEYLSETRSVVSRTRAVVLPSGPTRDGAMSMTIQSVS